MAEKGIIVNDSATGESVACRDAAELDDDSNARIIQRVDVCKGKLPTPFRDSANKIRTGVSLDGKATYNWGTDGVLTNLLTVGDKSTLVAQVESDASTGTIKVIAVMIESDDTTVQGFLLEQEVDLSATGTEVMRLQASPALYISSMLTWDVTGADKVGIAIVENTDGYNSMDVYAAVI